MWVRAFRSGLFLGSRWPLMVLALWLAQLAIALPAAFVVGHRLAGSIEGTLAEDRLLEGFDTAWFGEFEDEARGVARTFHPSLISGGAFFLNLERWLSGELWEGTPAIVGAGLVWAAVWTFLLGGVLGRFVRARTGAKRAPFLRDSARWFVRFARLALISAPLYYLVYRLSDWMLRGLAERLRDGIVEGAALLWTLGAVAIVALALTAVHCSFTYAKIGAVLDDRRSMFLAALRGAAFVALNPWRTLSLHAAFFGIGFVAVFLYHALSPGVGQTTWTGIVAVFAGAQVFLIFRLWLRLSCLGAETALFVGVTRPESEADAPK